MDGEIFFGSFVGGYYFLDDVGYVGSIFWLYGVNGEIIYFYKLVFICKGNDLIFFKNKNRLFGEFECIFGFEFIW